MNFIGETKMKLGRINVRNALQVIAGSGGLAMLVFATITVQAPTIFGGMVITAAIYVLTLLALLGIFKTQSIWNAAQHLVIATIASLPFAFVGGVFWAGEPIEQLLSLNFFTSVALIAFLIGVFSGAIVDAKTR